MVGSVARRPSAFCIGSTDVSPHRSEQVPYLTWASPCRLLHHSCHIWPSLDSRMTAFRSSKDKRTSTRLVSRSSMKKGRPVAYERGNRTPLETASLPVYRGSVSPSVRLRCVKFLSAQAGRALPAGRRDHGALGTWRQPASAAQRPA